MVASISSKANLARDVALLHSQHFAILEEYQLALTAIQSHKLQDSLTKYVPSDIPKENLTYTLADWANVTELSKVEDEAVQELQELEVRPLLQLYMLITIFNLRCARNYELGYQRPSKRRNSSSLASARFARKH